MRGCVVFVQVSELQFGPLQSGALSVDCSVTWRNLSASGPGINTNYLMDIAPEWRNPGGPTFQQALQVSGLSAIPTNLGSHHLWDAGHWSKLLLCFKTNIVPWHLLS